MSPWWVHAGKFLSIKNTAFCCNIWYSCWTWVYSCHHSANVHWSKNIKQILFIVPFLSFFQKSRTHEIKKIRYQKNSVMVIGYYKLLTDLSLSAKKRLQLWLTPMLWRLNGKLCMMDFSNMIDVFSTNKLWTEPNYFVQNVLGNSNLLHQALVYLVPLQLPNFS